MNVPNHNPGNPNMQFDSQSEIYDQRTGLGVNTAQKVAQAIHKIAEELSEKGLILEIGAGTGEIGAELFPLTPQYIGFDLSKGMLKMYQNRLDDPGRPPLVQADGNQPWPFKEASVSVFFSSRAIHQLDRQHVLNQLNRLANRDQALLILGNVKRSGDAVKTVVRKQMHQILNLYGIQEKSGQSNRKALFSAIKQQGGVAIPAITVNRWQVSHAPIDSIKSWQKVDGLAGRDIDPAMKNKILETLETQLQTLYPNLHTPIASEESYELNAIKLMT